jgi:hypothetical protein
LEILTELQGPDLVSEPVLEAEEYRGLTGLKINGEGN